MGLTTDLQRTYNGPTTNIHFNLKKTIIMKQYIFLPIALVATLALMLLSSCTITFGTPGEAIEPGELTKETRKLDIFNSITAKGSIDIEYVVSDSSYIEIEAGKNLLPHLKTEVHDKKLKIQLDNAGGTPFFSKDNRTFHFRPSDGINNPNVKVKVFSPSLEEINIAGATDFKADSLSTTEKFKVSSAGHADINIKNVACNNAKIEIAGQSDVEIGNITCQNINIETAGQSDFKLNVNGADNTEVTVAGQCDAEITFNKCNRAGINVAGASDLTLKGTLNILDKHIAGVCSMDTDELKLTNKNDK